jgi:hypothetical protein
MNNSLHIFVSILSLLQPIFMLIAMLGWVYAMVSRLLPNRRLMTWEPRNQSVRFALGIVTFISLIGSLFLFDAIVKSVALEEIHAKLSSSVESVAVDGRSFERPEELIAALRTMRNSPAHHSSPCRSYLIDLKTAQGPLTLCLSRDSQNTNEYWVFYPGFNSTQSNEIGRVFTDLLDGK